MSSESRQCRRPSFPLSYLQSKMFHLHYYNRCVHVCDHRSPIEKPNLNPSLRVLINCREWKANNGVRKLANEPALMAHSSSLSHLACLFTHSKNKSHWLTWFGIVNQAADADNHLSHFSIRQSRFHTHTHTHTHLSQQTPRQKFKLYKRNTHLSFCHCVQIQIKKWEKWLMARL